MPNAPGRPLLLLILLLQNFSANSQTTEPPLTRPVCLTLAQARAVRDSLRHLPLVRDEAREWQRAYVQARLAADTITYAAQQNKHALVAAQRAYQGQLLALEEQRRETQKFRARAHRKGWVLTVLLASLGLLVYLQ